MRKGCLLCLLAVWWTGAGRALAQQGATTVQLPTFSNFSIGTTVTVPDRGMAYLGGINRAASGRNEFGVPLLPFRPFRNSAIGREASASNMWVTATIHDFQAMDRYLLSQPTAFSRSLASGRPAVAGLGGALRPRDSRTGASWQVSVVPGNPPRGSVAEARADRQRQQATRASEAADFFQRGQKAEAAGKAGVARIYYQMAARRATGELKEQIAARLGGLSRREAGSRIAQNRP